MTALKTLVLTSTPSSPNRQLHPQLQPSGTRGAYKHHGHSRNKSMSSAHPPPPGRAEPPIQAASTEEREVGRFRAPVLVVLFLPAVPFLPVLTLTPQPFFLSASGVSSSPSLLLLLSSL